MDQSIKSIRTLLVDDEPQFLKTASWFLSTEQRYRVVGSVSTIADMHATITEQQLDLILIDLQLVLNNVDEFERIVKALAAEPKIILMSMFDTEHCRHHAHLYGADDCIAKVQFADGIEQLTRKFFPS